MSTQENFFEESKKKIEEYVQDRLLLFKLEAVEKTSRLIATMFTGLLIALFAFLIVFFISFMLGYLLGELIHHIYWGFAIVAAFYIILLVIIIVFRKRLVEKRIINMVIDIFFEKDRETKEETHEQ